MSLEVLKKMAKEKQVFFFRELCQKSQSYSCSGKPEITSLPLF